MSQQLVTTDWLVDPARSVAELLRMGREFDASKPDNNGFLQGTPFLDQRYLLSVPFVFRSEWVFKKEPPKEGVSRDGRPYHIDEQDVAQFMCSLVGIHGTEDSWSLGEPQLATVKGGYVLNDLRQLSYNEAAVDIWTFARDQSQKAYTNPSTKAIEYPIRLRRWRYDREVAPTPF